MLVFCLTWLLYVMLTVCGWTFVLGGWWLVSLRLVDCWLPVVVLLGVLISDLFGAAAFCNGWFKLRLIYVAIIFMGCLFGLMLWILWSVVRGFCWTLCFVFV